MALFAGLPFIQHEAQAQGWSSGGPLSPLQSGFEIGYYQFNLDVFPDEQKISGYVTAHVFALADDVTEIEFDLVRNYEVSSVTASEKELTFSHEEDKLIVTLPDVLKKDEMKPLRIHYSGVPPVAERPPWEGGFTWETDPDGNHWVGVSCQLEGGKMWLPVKDHPVSRPDSVEISITVPEPYTVAANGLHQETVSDGEGRHTWRWKTRYPIHWYNINFTMGIFDKVSTVYYTENGSEMPVDFYVLKADRHKAPELLEITVDMLEQLRHYFGEYAFTDEKFGLVHTPYLGMEHQTINAYGNNFEYTYHNERPYDWLLLHEMGHEWWGNAVTVKDWADFWIHEGITTFTDALFLWDYYSPEVYYDKIMEYVQHIRNHQPIIPGVDVTSAEVYNHDVYYKGAWFMHTLMHVMRRPVFLEAMRSFAIENRYGYTDTESLMEHLQKYTAVNLEPLFRTYLYETGLPDIITEKAGDGYWNVYLTGIDATFPVGISKNGNTSVMMLSPEPKKIRSKEKPETDTGNWYLKQSMFEE